MTKLAHREFLQVTESEIELGEPLVLSPREQETTLHIAEGFTAKDIARMMNIAVRTVNAFADNAMNKLGARNRSHLVSRCYTLGILRASIKQRGSAALSALWLMLTLTVAPLIILPLTEDLEADLFRARVRNHRQIRIRGGGRQGRKKDDLEPGSLFNIMVMAND